MGKKCAGRPVCSCFACLASCALVLAATALDFDMPLRLVKSVEPSPKQAVIERVKKFPNLDGIWQCNRCGCRTSLTTENGVMTKNGRKQGGTVIDKDVCASCWKNGIDSPMRPKLKAEK